MSEQGRGPNAKAVLVVLALGAAIACAVGNGLGQRHGCEHQGKQIRGLECVEKEGK